MTKLVPNIFPRITNQEYRIAIVGDAPNDTDELSGRPFTGVSGRLLDNILAQYGILRDACLLANISQHRAPGNYFDRLGWDHEHVISGRQQLTYDLQTFQPKLVLGLGNAALHFLKNEPLAIDAWRGSIFTSTLGFKALCTFHPSSLLRVYPDLFPFRLDIKKARREGTHSDIRLPSRQLEVDLTPEQTIDKLEELSTTKPLIAIDIEGYVDNMTCISIATSESYAFIVPFTNSFWTLELEIRMWRALAKVLSDPSIPKILQNAMYDLFVLQHGYKIPVRGLAADIMLQHWELVCEAPKSLAFQASIYTNEPYWKNERESTEEEVCPGH